MLLSVFSDPDLLPISDMPGEPKCNNQTWISITTLALIMNLIYLINPKFYEINIDDMFDKWSQRSISNLVVILYCL